MKKSVWLWELAGLTAVSVGGTLLHYLYEWLGEAVWIAPFSGVNESTWEHMKLLFWPMLAWAGVQSLFFRNYPSFWCIKLRGILMGLALIPLIFYVYNGAIAKSPDWINIAIFFVSAAIAFFYEARLFKKDTTDYRSCGGCLFTLCLIGLAFIIFTFITPEIRIFRDPLTGSYGI